LPGSDFANKKGAPLSHDIPLNQKWRPQGDLNPCCRRVEVVKVLGAIYTVGDNTMLTGSVVAEVDQTEFGPYAFMKIDALR
jgi:hypothetical protein